MTHRLGAEAIEDAAIELFAERGVDAVTMSDIQKASGHRNRSAVAYHFGGKEELVEALITRIVVDHDDQRIAGLDRLEAETTNPTLEAILDVAVAPMVHDLSSRRTRLRLRMLANVVADERHMAFTQQLMATHPGLGRSTQAILGHMGDLPEQIRLERVILATSFGLQAFADQARRMDAPAPDPVPLDTAAFTDHIVELLEALLTTPHRPRR